MRLRSTKKTNRTEALSIAADWERIDKKVASGEMAESQVRKVVNDILERAGHSPLEVPTIRKWCTEWLQEKETSKTSGTAERYKYVIDAFLIHLKDRAEKSLSALTSRDVQGYVTKRIGQKVSNATVNVDGKILRTCFNRARRQGLIPINPAKAVDLPSKRSVERGTFTAAEVKMLIDACKKDEWKTVILFGYYTGARLGDCTRIEWKNLNLGNRTLTFFEGKSQKNIVMPLHPDLANHLENIATSDKPEKFVTPKLAVASTGGQHGMSESFKRIVNNAGLDLQTVQGTGVRMISKRTFHALRHSFTSALANAGVSPELRMKLTGHKSAEIHRGYTHLEMETLKEALEKLPSLTSPQG